MPFATETFTPGATPFDSSAQSWPETLSGISTELECLNRDTELEFLKIGAKVSEFIDTVSCLSRELGALADIVSGEQGQRASDALTGVLEVSSEMRARSEEGGRLLGNMRQEAGRVRQTLAHFSGTVATFHSLGLLTRIETARLGSAGADFGNLAEEVRLLARNVQSRVESALDTAGELIPRIENALQEVSALQEGQAKNLPLVIAQVSENLSSFREMQAEAHASSLRLGAEYAEIGEAFKRVIVSMQFNDITRQQVEHVIDVLRRLNSETRPEDGVPLIQTPGAASVLELQFSQLANTGNKFSSSVAAVAQSFDEIVNHVAKMVEESGALSGLSGKSSFFRQMERGCSAILSNLTLCANADAATESTSDGLAEKIARMRASIEEIRVIETQMRRIAMNARISAEHLGPAGEALSALANAIKVRASESRLGSDSLVETLEKMNAVVGDLTAHARPQAGKREAQEGCFESMRSAIAQLRDSQEDGASQIAVITAHGDALRKSISGARENLSAAARFGEVVDLTRSKLLAIMTEMRAGWSHEESQEGALGLAQFSKHYTMQEERDIARGTAAPAAAQSIDDVEFF